MNKRQSKNPYIDIDVQAISAKLSNNICIRPSLQLIQGNNPDLYLPNTLFFSPTEGDWTACFQKKPAVLFICPDYDLNAVVLG